MLTQPTRTNLRLLRERVTAVVGCNVILKGRRQVLIKELLAIGRPFLHSREALRRQLGEAIVDLSEASQREGESYIASLALSNRRPFPIHIRERNLLGLRYRDVESDESVRRRLDERGYDYPSVTPQLDTALAHFEEVVEKTLELARYEGVFRRLAEELQRLTRRIRVLEERLLPTLRGEIHRILQYLGEREREEYFRLKRFKERRERSEAEGAIS